MPSTTKSKSAGKKAANPAMWGMSLGAYEDLFEGQAFSAVSKMQSVSLDATRKCVEKQWDFAMSRWQEDLHLMSSLAECRDAETVTDILQGFYSRMLDTYTKHITSQSELMQSCVTESLTAAEELRETASEITRVATEQISDAANDIGKPRAA